MPPQSIGAFYQCHKEPVGFLQTVLYFRHHYPEATLVLHNDRGYDYAAFAEKQRAHYTYHTERAESVRMSSTKPDSAIAFIRRLWSSLPLFKEEYILLLEDDVRVVRPHTLPFEYHINGRNPHVAFPPAMAQALWERGYRGPQWFGGCGGCVLHRRFLEMIPIEEAIEVLRPLQIPTFATDLCLSFLTRYYGGLIGPYAEFAEMWYPDLEQRVQENSFAFLHQYKSDYGKKPGPPELALLKWDKVPEN